MDTPKKNQIGTPLSTFEDSPVFNYISNLSPIKPVKSVHITQTFQSLSFSAIPSVFTSPHISTQKESRFLSRHQSLDLSRLEFSPDCGDKSKASNGVSVSVFLSSCSSDAREKCNHGASIEEFNVDPPTERPKLAIKRCQTLQYDSGSPNNNVLPCYSTKMDNETAMAGTPVMLVRFVQESPKERYNTSETKVEYQGISQLEPMKEEGPGCDWENLISDAIIDDLLIFDGSTESDACREQDQKLVDSDSISFASLLSRPPQDNIDVSQEMQPLACHKHMTQDPVSHPGEVGQQNETDHTPQILSAYQCEQGTRDPSEKMDEKARDYISLGCKVDTQQQRGMRRRCLVFEVARVLKKNLDDDLKSCHSNMLLQCDGNFASHDKQSVPPKTGIGSSSCKLPGIGLHFNALLTTSQDCGMVKQETLASERLLISLPTSVGSFHSLAVGQKPLDKSLALNSIEGELSQAMNEVQIMQDGLQVPASGVDEDFSQNSLKKKRRRLENDGESGTCKRCNCKKSKCLKLYCECFAAGVYCIEPCSCQDCFNKPVHEDTVLATRKQIESRNPLAFAPKVIRSSDSVPDAGEESSSTPASARHKRGCNCKKSSCLKKYCECFQGGVGCSINCRCEGCKNKFGRKDGSAPTGIEEAEPEGEVSEASEKDGPNERLQLIEAQKEEQQYSGGALPITPSFQNWSVKATPSLLPVGSSPCLEKWLPDTQ